MARGSRQRVHRRRNRRKVGIRKPKKTLLVFCEGDVTEPDYIRALKGDPSVHQVAAVEIQVSKGTIGITPPLKLVKAAEDALQRSTYESREIDEIWCLFDVEWPDNHPDLHQALALAKKVGIHTAVSNPCFEVWLALHFEHCRQWLTKKDADRIRKQYDGSKPGEKRVDGAMYMPRRGQAVRHARLLEQMHESEGKRFPDNNPSSGMYLLLETIPGVGVGDH